jgi:hypothetical protein
MSDKPSSAVLLSVIVPIGPGEREADGLLRQLRALPRTAELIVATAEPTSAKWKLPTVVPVAAEGGRARMMNAGAAQASGAWLWFLHADTRLLPGSLEALALFLRRETPALGWFDLRFRADGPALTRFNALGANLRARWLGIPFGDQAFVIRASDFRALGGFDEQASYGEDHLFVWTARGAGIPARRIGAAVATSARKYARHGWARTTLRHWWLTAEQAWPAWRRLRRP